MYDWISTCWLHVRVLIHGQYDLSVVLSEGLQVNWSVCLLSCSCRHSAGQQPSLISDPVITMANIPLSWKHDYLDIYHVITFFFLHACISFMLVGIEYTLRNPKRIMYLRFRRSFGKLPIKIAGCPRRPTLKTKPESWWLGLCVFWCVSDRWTD